jgi:hypothetical protein
LPRKRTAIGKTKRTCRGSGSGKVAPFVEQFSIQNETNPSSESWHLISVYFQHASGECFLTSWDKNACAQSKRKSKRATGDEPGKYQTADKIYSDEADGAIKIQRAAVNELCVQPKEQIKLDAELHKTQSKAHK